MKKTLKWIVLALVLCLAVGVFAGCKNKENLNKDNTTLYWNVEKFVYSSVESERIAREDGYYYVCVATGGEQKYVPVADKLLVDFMDTLEVMGLEMDDNGVVTKVLRVEEMGYTIAAEDYYVEQTSETEIIVNSLGTFRGNAKTFQIDQAAVFGVDMDGGLLCGLPGVIQVGSKVMVLKDQNGVVSCVYTEDPFQMQDIYWNTKRTYDSATKMSTRETDAAGRFVYTFAINGEQVTLYTRDQKVANSIDSIAAKCMGLTFDEEGYITGTISTKKATGNSSFGSWYHIMDIQGDMVSAHKYGTAKDAGSSVRGQMAPGCKVYDCSGTGAYIGEPTELRLYDQVHGLKNPFGQIAMIFVVGRTVEADIYYNVSRQWNSSSQTTKRIPDTDGWYKITMAKDGKQVTLKTQDKELVNTIDKQAARCVGLEVEDGVIKAAYASSNVWGGRQFCSYDVVTDITDGVITAVEQDASKQPATYVGKMAENCGVYNCSTGAGFIGEETILMVNDKIHALKDLDGNVTHIFIVDRPIYADIYWNVSRQWDSKTESTKRIPNAEGYYEILLAVNGAQKTYKTKDINLVNAMDKIATKCFGLYTDGDIITEVFATSKVYGGSQFCSWDDVIEIDGSYITAKEADASKGDKTYSGRMSHKCKIYDVSGNGAFIGEQTQLRLEDKIHALKRPDGTITYIFIVSRVKQQKVEEGYCSTCDKTVTWYSWDGVKKLEQDHYFIDEPTKVSQTAYIGSAEDNTPKVCLDLRGQTVTGSVRIFRVYGTLNIMDSQGGGLITSQYGSQAAVFYVYNGAQMNLYSGTLTGTSTSTSGGGVGAVDNGILNIYGGSIKDGVSGGAGGNVIMYNTSVINMYGGIIENGTAATNGGNIQMSAKGSLNIYGGSVIGGTAATGGCINATGAVKFYGGGVITIDQIRLASGKIIDVIGELAKNSSVGVLLADGVGTVAYTDTENNLEFFKIDDAENIIKYDAGKILIEPKPIVHEHCVCGGVGGHGACSGVVYEVWTGELGAGTYNYCLAGDLSADAMIEIPSGCTLNLCLNGHNIKGADRVFQINGTLNLCDCQGGGEVTSTKVRQAQIFYVRDGGVFNMFGGTLKGTKTMASDGGLGAIGLNADGGAIMNMYGGTITGGTTTKNGGNITLYHDSVLTIYGGTIEKGVADSGGNIFLNNAKAVLNLRGGAISGGTSTGAGGNIRISSGTLNVYSGTISGGTTENGNGGSIFMTGANAFMNMYGGIITGGYAGTGATARKGGNIYVGSSSRFNVYDDPAIEGVPTITDGITEENEGGNIYYTGKSMTINGAIITGGSAPGAGDDIYIATSGAVIKGNVTADDITVKAGISVDTFLLDEESDCIITNG